MFWEFSTEINRNQTKYFRIFIFTYVLYRGLGQSVLFFSEMFWWFSTRANQNISESSFLHMFSIGNWLAFDSWRRGVNKIGKWQIPCGSSNFENSMCHSLSSDHFGDKSFKESIKVCHKIRSSQKNWAAYGGNVSNLWCDSRENLSALLKTPSWSGQPRWVNAYQVFQTEPDGPYRVTMDVHSPWNHHHLPYLRVRQD